MNCELINQTPFATHLHPHRDANDRPCVSLIVKASFNLHTARLAAAEDQAPILEAPVMRVLGDLDLDEAQRRALGDRVGQRIVWIDHDITPPKPVYDIVLAAYATAPAGHAAPSIDAGLQIDKHFYTLRAFAPRLWTPGSLGWSNTPLSPVVRRVPISVAVSDSPWGCAHDAKASTPQARPWIEAIDEPSQIDRYPRTAVSWGPWPESSPHRLAHAGTYNEAWQKQRSPLLPKDFSPRFYNVAHPQLQWPAPPVHDAALNLVNLSTQSVIKSRIPHMDFAVQPLQRNGQQPPAVALRADTLIIEPEHHRFSQVWRASIPLNEGDLRVRTLRLFRASTHRHT